MKRHLILALLALLHAWPQLSVAAESTASEARRPGPHVLRERQAFPGSISNDLAAESGPYPLHKRFEHFTAEEKDALRALYEGMPKEDEPPFPKHGMRDVIAHVSQLVGQFAVQGDLTMFITIGSDGRAASFSILQTPDPEVAKAVAFVFLKTEFKPAVCGGVPCRGEFPFRVRLTLSRL